MLTSRAWWFLVAVVVLLTFGLLAGQAVFALVGLAALFWFTWEGLTFSFRARHVARGLGLRRQVYDDRGPVTALWAGRTFTVRTVLRLRSSRLPYVAIEEFLPFGLEYAGGVFQDEGELSEDEPLGLAYTVRAAHAGKVRFEGVRVRMADLHGLFYHATFVRLEAVYRVLPPLVDAEGKTATTKRYNMLPPPGINHLRRPGSSSELLDLRDYLPGDPPKTIAWKVSARRDRLVTKVYETEVPVRCTLFVDTSRAVRLGPPGQNALARLVEIASAVAQANMASRDLTGLCLFDEERVEVLQPARTRRHLVEVFNRLADAAGRAPAAGASADVDALLPLAYSFAQEVYPDQIADGVNQVPFWMPLFVRVPGHWAEPASGAEKVYRWFTLTLATAAYAAVGVVLFALLSILYFDPIPEDWRDQLMALIRARGTPEEWRAQVLPPYDLSLLGLAIVLLFFFPLWAALVRDALPLLFSGRRRRATRRRKKLAALFARRYGLGPGGLELLLHDEEQFGLYLERFLNEHHVPHTPALYDASGRFLYASSEKVEVLARALTRSVGKGHDNELFVLLVDLAELEGSLGPLVRAVKVALARHHQVVVICPWPPDLAPPGKEPPTDELDELLSLDGGGRSGRPRRRGSASLLGAAAGLSLLLRRVLARRYRKAFYRLRRTFARLHVPVVSAAANESVPLILDRIDRLRGLRRRR